MTQWIEKAKSSFVANIGQLTREDVRALDKAVKSGILIKHRGYWDTGLPIAGMGNLKTIWRAA